MPVIGERTEIAIDTILLATDFTSVSACATAYAAAIARRYGSTVELVHVVDQSAILPSAEAMVYFPFEELKRSSQSMLTDVAQEIPGIKTKTNVMEAFSPAPAILDAASDAKAELIVMGTSAKAGVERLILGSTAQEVLRHAKCPVLTVGPCAVKPGPGPLPFRTIVYASDFTPEASKAASYALAFAEDSGGHLYLCHVLQEKESASPQREKSALLALGKLIPPFATDWCSPECVLEYGHAAEGILKLARRVQADLIVLGARKGSFWLTHVGNSVSPAVLAEASCPVLTVC